MTLIGRNNVALHVNRRKPPRRASDFEPHKGDQLIGQMYPVGWRLAASLDRHARANALANFQH